MIKSIEQLRSIVPSVFGRDFELYRSAIADASRWVESQVLGEDIFAVLDSDSELLSLIDSVIAFRACRDVTPKLDVFHDGQGFVVVNDERYSPASRDRVNSLISSLDSSMNSALTLLYEYIEDSESLVSKFKKTDRCSIVMGSLLPSLREFSLFRPFDGGYLRWVDERFRHSMILVGLFYPRFSEQFISAVLSYETNNNVLLTLKHAFASAFAGDLVTFNSFCDIAIAEIRRNPELYPSCPIGSIEPYRSTSFISML